MLQMNQIQPAIQSKEPGVGLMILEDGDFIIHGIQLVKQLRKKKQFVLLFELKKSSQ